MHHDELLVIADGATARVVSLTSDKEWFMQWRTIDGEKLDPLGQFRESETLIRGMFQRDLLLDYLRNFILFDDDGNIVKKIAGYHQFHAVRKAVSDTIRWQIKHGISLGHLTRIAVLWRTHLQTGSNNLCSPFGIIFLSP